MVFNSFSFQWYRHSTLYSLDFMIAIILVLCCIMQACIQVQICNTWKLNIPYWINILIEVYRSFLWFHILNMHFIQLTMSAILIWSLCGALTILHYEKLTRYKMLHRIFKQSDLDILVILILEWNVLNSIIFLMWSIKFFCYLIWVMHLMTGFLFTYFTSITLN